MKYINWIVLITALLPGVAISGVPGQVNFQGVLFNNASQVINGNVNFNFTLYDAAIGGTQLWTESQNGVTVNAGIYTVALGSTTPLTTDILSNGSVFLEVTVDGEILSPRQRLLAVPYALRAEEANFVGGVSNIFIQQLYKNLDYDGQSLANDDPLEGVVDTDQDGLSNFMDPDNDGDGITDDVEINNGTGVNLVTPIISTISAPQLPPALARAGVPNLITISGTGFISGLTVQVGTDSPTVQNFTNTSFDIIVGNGQVAGPSTVTLTNPNAETTTGLMHFYDKLVFVSSNSIANAMHQSITTADAFCAQAASGAGLPGNFIAWYSDPDNNISAIDRMPINGGAWSRLDGLLVATGLNDLTDGTINIAISIDEYGATVPNGTLTATNTFETGLVNPNSCAGNDLNSGFNGRTTDQNVFWTRFAYFGTCQTSRPYYCFEK